MSDMIFEWKLPLELAKYKEQLGLGDLYKYLRYFKMFMERFKVYEGEEDKSFRLFYKYLFRGKVALVKDAVYGLVICDIDDKKSVVNPNGKLTRVDVKGENGFHRKNLEVGKDVVVSYYDNTHIPPFLYLWGIVNQIITVEDIIMQQDNMLRKPIVVTGEGVDFDNAMNNAVNVLSGVAWINTKTNNKGNKGKNIMSEQPMEVLNLQVGNAYKGVELWEDRKRREELVCDYLGYTTTKNEKRERMNEKEVMNENSIGQTFYKACVKSLEDMIKEVKTVLKVDLKLVKLLEESEVSNNGDKETMDRTSDE